MKVILIGHSYVEEENRKNIYSLSKFVDLKVIVPNKSDGMIFSYDIKKRKIEGNGWEISFFDKVKIPFFPSAIYLLKSRDLGIKSFRPDVIHIEYDPFHPLFIQLFLTCKLYRFDCKVISTVKQNTYTSYGTILDLIKDSVAKFFSKYVSSFITVNSGVETIYVERFKQPKYKMNRCTHLGVDTDLFSPLKNNSKIQNTLKTRNFKIGYVGRVIEYKGVTDLIEAVIKINEKSDLRLNLELVGKGPSLTRLKNKYEKYDYILFMGSIIHSDVASFLKSLDIFVMPSRILDIHVEHDSHALLEAMACGIPSIASISGSNKDVLEEFDECLFLPEDVEVLKIKILEVINNYEKYINLAKKMRDLVKEKYSIDSVASEYFKIYKR